MVAIEQYNKASLNGCETISVPNLKSRVRDAVHQNLTVNDYTFPSCYKLIVRDDAFALCYNLLMSDGPFALSFCKTAMVSTC